VATLSDLYSGATSAVGTLKGPLHGGANEGVMKMLLRIDTPEKADDFVRAALEAGEKISGFGHRIYRTLDPRAPVLKVLAEQLAKQKGTARWLEIAERVQVVMAEEMTRRNKRVYPNVDFFSAPLYFTMGIPTEHFTNIFACARMPGWTAHMLEQLANNRLIRPGSTYIGPQGQKVTPIAQR
jgi:citrate synthase